MADAVSPARGQSAADQGTGKRIEIARAAQPPVVDGRIDPREWAQATLVEDLVQVEPVENAPPSDRMRVYVMYDADTLYVAAKMWDREPANVTANILRQGEDLMDDDTFGVVLDTFNDRRSGYWFELNPNGVRRQAIYENVTERNFDWRGIWSGMSRRDEEGWTAEMAIPLKTISFDPASEHWGINFRRKVERRGEFVGWVSRNGQVNPGVTGMATGLRGLQQGLGLDVAPSLSVRQERDYAPGDRSSRLEPSLDVFYKLTPSLTAALTVNTDFSATEVDDRQVNLTRFGLFFPEKRSFFLQDADIFEFGRISSNGNDTEFSDSTLENGRPFFSRRIGLGDDGLPVDLEVGGKLTGRIGRWNVGVLDVQQAAYGEVDSSNLFVGRAVANILEESSVGLVVTSGNPRSNLSNSVAGVDFRYRNTRLPGDNILEAEAWYQQSETRGVRGDDAAYGFGIRLPNETGWRAGIRMKELQENFFPALGFVNNVGVRDYMLDARYLLRREAFLQDIYATADVQRVELIDGGLQSQVATIRPLVIETSAGEALELSYIASKEVLYEGFEIAEGVVLAPGSYSFDEYKLAVETGGHRKLAGTIRLAHGDFYSGERLNVEGEITWRPSPHFAFGMEYEYFDVDLPEGSFIARLMQARADIVFSSTLAWSNLVQYDNESEVVGVNSRLHWIPQAGRETFLVLNYALQDYDRNNRFDSERGELALKVGYTFRF